MWIQDIAGRSASHSAKTYSNWSLVALREESKKSSGAEVGEGGIVGTGRAVKCSIAHRGIKCRVSSGWSCSQQRVVVLDG